MRQIFAVIMMITMVSMISIAAAELPASFYTAMNNMKNEDTLCVKNYDAGASITESYTDFESLHKDTQIVSKSKINSTNPAVLEASINSDVIGNAHIAWQSRSPLVDSKGRHAVISRSSEDMTGVFSIEKFLQLWSNSTIEGLSIDWLPCS